MSTAAVAHVTARPLPLVSAEYVQQLTGRIATLERELRQRSTTIATLRRELTRAIEAPTVVSVNVVDGMLTMTMSTGAVLQRRPRVIDTPEEFSYGYAWVNLAPIPGTRAEIVESVFAADDNVPDHYATAQRRIAETQMLGMAVVAGEEA